MLRSFAESCALEHVCAVHRLRGKTRALQAAQHGNVRHGSEAN